MAWSQLAAWKGVLVVPSSHYTIVQACWEAHVCYRSMDRKDGRDTSPISRISPSPFPLTPIRVRAIEASANGTTAQPSHNSTPPQNSPSRPPDVSKREHPSKLCFLPPAHPTSPFPPSFPPSSSPPSHGPNTGMALHLLHPMVQPYQFLAQKPEQTATARLSVPEDNWPADLPLLWSEGYESRAEMKRE